jgi:hypothetical protein
VRRTKFGTSTALFAELQFDKSAERFPESVRAVLDADEEWSWENVEFSATLQKIPNGFSVMFAEQNTRNT